MANGPKYTEPQQHQCGEGDAQLSSDPSWGWWRAFSSVEGQGPPLQQHQNIFSSPRALIQHSLFWFSPPLLASSSHRNRSSFPDPTICCGYRRRIFSSTLHESVTLLLFPPTPPLQCSLFSLAALFSGAVPLFFPFTLLNVFA